jgi:HAD superfamily hydrolase (TIGR01458 family)
VWDRGVVSARLVGISALLVDLDGVLYVEDRVIAGACETVATLRATGLALRFVTNTTSRSHAQGVGKLRRLGFDVAAEELLTPARLAVRYCVQRGHHRALLVMNEEVKEDFGELGECIGGRAEVVIVGDLGDAFGYDVLNRAFRAVMNGAELVALQKNRYWMRADGLSVDVGPFVAALEYATRREAIVVGKPARSFFELALADLSAKADAAAMVGDDIETDIGGALAAGIAGVLVRTGKYLEQAVRGSRITPTATIDSIVDLPALLGARRS